MGAVWRNMNLLDLPAVGYDIDHSPLQDFLTTAGLVTAVQWCRRLVSGGGTHWATVCSTWVWMSRRSTGRNKERVLGSDTSAVRAANIMVSRCAMFLLFLMSKRCSWIVEQPVSSIMFLHPRMVEVSGREPFALSFDRGRNKENSPSH